MEINPRAKKDRESPYTHEMDGIPLDILDLRDGVCDIIPMSGDQLISELQAKVAFHRRELTIWQAALDSALRSSQKKKDRAYGKQEALVASGSKSVEPIAPSPYIIRLIQARQQVGGISSTEVRSQAAEDKMSFAQDKGFPYKQLNRLKRAGTVKREEGRYFLAK
jgi:hypothetical protein